MSAELRAAMGKAAVKAAQAVGYVGAGTVEFIADGADGLRADRYWFMEMNTRLQVEHPVTEAITGLDLVEWQFRVAAGETLNLTQGQVPMRGHAVEARVYAEDPERGFLPSTGRLLALQLPESEGIRVDTGVETGSEISPFYDPMVAKVIAHAPTREEALDRLARALDATIAAGPRTNLAFLAALCRAPDFVAGRFDTGFIDRNLPALNSGGTDRGAAAFGLLRLIGRDAARIARNLGKTKEEPASPWDAADGFQLSGSRSLTVSVLIDGEPAEADVTYGPGDPTVAVDGVPPDLDAVAIEAADAVYVVRRGRQTVVRRPPLAGGDVGHGGGDGLIKAPMHGKVLALFVAAGDSVVKGQRLAIIEAMKMEHALLAPHAGRVSEIAVAAGGQAAEGAKIMTIEPTDEAN